MRCRSCVPGAEAMVWLRAMPLIRRAQYIAAQPRGLTMHAEPVLLYILGLEAGPSMTPLVSAFAISGDSTYSVFRAPLREPGSIVCGWCMSKCSIACSERYSSSAYLLLTESSRR